MCDRHYNRWLKSGATADPIKLVVARCTVAKCPGSVVGWGYCATHYANWRHTGDPLAAPVAWRTRFFMKVDRRSDDECWPWLGAINATTGYGYFNQEGQTRLAHGVAYEIGIGPVPDGLQLDHQCRNRPCVNWHHLMPVTAHENILRSNGASAQYARRTHCSHGHPFTPENTHWAADGRRCLTCAASKLEAHVRQ